MSALTDLSKIPQPDFLESLNFETLFQTRKNAFLTLCTDEEKVIWARRLELESEPVTKLLQESTYRELLLRQRINHGALAVSLAHARGADLDNIAANYNVARLVIQPADITHNISVQLESDDALRYRTQLAFDSISTAGAKSSYEYHALSASGSVADVNVHSNKPCYVTVTILSHQDKGIADNALLDKVLAILNDDNVRPVADRLTVQSARIVDYQIDAVIYTYKGPEKEPIYTQALANINAFVKRQLRLGKTVHLSAIYAALHVEGVQGVEILLPRQDISLERDQAGYCTQLAINVKEMAND